MKQTSEEATNKNPKSTKKKSNEIWSQKVKYKSGSTQVIYEKKMYRWNIQNEKYSSMSGVKPWCRA